MAGRHAAESEPDAGLSAAWVNSLARPEPRHRVHDVARETLRAEYAALGIPLPPEQRPLARFRIHKRKGQLKRAKSTPWHLLDRASGRGWLVNTWRGALDLAAAVAA